MADLSNLNEDLKDSEAYRDSIATVDKSGKRIWLFPKMPRGPFYDYRKWLSYALLIALFGLPFIKINGDPLVLFNIPKAQFIIFGVYFSPQDFHLLVIGMLAAIVFVALFTVVFGRLFCGWICPQTIFMEMVFRRIEYWIEGDSSAQRRLAKAPWDLDKTIKKVSKHIIFIIISILIANIFLAYIISIDEVWKIINEPIAEHWQGFLAMLIFTAVFYAVFTVLREQVCTSICPYGRLQGVLLDEKSLAVAYDFVRGEPRGKLSKAAQKKKKREHQGTCDNCSTKSTAKEFMIDTSPVLGDCIDCKLCVQVCPTGIDIRNGTQLECVNCTACIDACDEVMVKIKKPKGLIRIDSYEGITKGVRAIWNPRVASYSLVLVALIGLESFLLVSRTAVETLFLRTPGTLFQDSNDGYISNLYNYQLINKTKEVGPVVFEVVGMDGVKFEIIGTSEPSTIANATTEGAVFIKIPKTELKKRKTNLKIEVLSDGKIISSANTTFFAPN